MINLIKIVIILHVDLSDRWDNKMSYIILR